MRPKEQILQNPRLKIVQAWKSGLMGYLLQPQAGPREVSVVARWDDDTEHVSVAAQNRDPTQGEMRMVQEIFGARGNAWCSETRALSCTDTACTCGKRTAQTQPRRRKGKNDGRFFDRRGHRLFGRL